MTGTFGSLKVWVSKLWASWMLSATSPVLGAIWAMSTLYDTSDWSQKDISVVTEPMKVEMIKRYQDIMSTEQLRGYREEMDLREKEGVPVTYIDMWGLAI
ncbi:cytosolic phospholipase A2 beta-like [Alosa alosa]|nr:cytosolic phospholipase A2 beta-like [Alosa alosa]